MKKRWEMQAEEKTIQAQAWNCRHENQRTTNIKDAKKDKK